MVKVKLVSDLHLIIKRYRKYENVRRYERLIQTDAVRKFELLNYRRLKDGGLLFQKPLKKDRAEKASFELSDYELIISYLKLRKTPEVIELHNEVIAAIERDEDRILELTYII